MDETEENTTIQLKKSTHKSLALRKYELEKSSFDELLKNDYLNEGE